MLNKPPSPLPESEKPQADPYSPEVRKYIQVNSIKRSIRHLSNSMGVLEGGMRSLYQKEPKIILEGLEVSPFEPVGMRESILETRFLIQQFIEVTGTQHLLTSPTPFEYTPPRNQKTPYEASRQLVSGLTGCRNSLKQLLSHADLFRQEKWGEKFLGKPILDRLTTISTVLNSMNSKSISTAPTVIRIPQKKIPAPKIPPAPKAKKRRLSPVDREKAKALLEIFEKNQHQFQTKFTYEIAKEIALQIEDEGVGFTFAQLRDLFECSDQQIKTSLTNLKKDLQLFNISLLGTFKPRSSYPITFWAENQQEPSTQSMK